MSAIDLSKYNIHTDLIIENNDILHHEEQDENITITKTFKDGNYITLSFEDITDNDNYNRVLSKFKNILKELLIKNKIKDSASCLVVGLGNRASTPDSLGVKTIDNITITKHLYELGSLSKGYRIVSAFTPGVMSATGLESSTILKAIIDISNPDFVIVIDALAARSINRINKTIQITDTGIHPGSGIGNNRLEISKKTLNKPIIAIGIPTVVSSSTIVSDTIEYLYKHISYIKNNEATHKLSINHTDYQNKLKDNDLSKEERINLLGLFGSLSDTESKDLINEVLNNTTLNYIVTPTEIDFLIDKLSKLLSSAINETLHNNSTN